LKIAQAILPPFLVLAVTVIISWATGNPQDLFLSYSTVGILIRFFLATPVLVAPIAVTPWLLALTARLERNSGLLGQFVRTAASPHHEFTLSDDLTLRPMQGIALSLIFAERFLNFLEYSTGVSYIAMVVRSTVFAFLMVNPLISLLLAFMWTLDDLGVRLYNEETGETRMLGSSIGIVLPLITGAIGVTTLFHRTTPTYALLDLIGSFMVLYPPYVVFSILHHEYVRRRFAGLSRILPFDRIETKVRHLRRGR